MSQFNYSGLDEEDEDDLNMTNVYEDNQSKSRYNNQVLDEEDPS